GEGRGGGRRGRRRGGRRRGRGRRGGRRRRGRGRRQGRRGGRRSGGRDDGPEGGKHHVPGVGRAEGQVTLLRAGGTGQDVLEVGGGAPVPHVEDVGHHLAAARSHEHRLAAREDGRHDQLVGGDRSGRARAGLGPVAVRYHGLVQRSHRGHMPVVGDRLLQIGGRRRQDGDRETRRRSGGILPVVEGDVARSAPRRRDRAGPRTIDVV